MSTNRLDGLLGLHFSFQVTSDTFFVTKDIYLIKKRLFTSGVLYLLLWVFFNKFLLIFNAMGGNKARLK